MRAPLFITKSVTPALAKCSGLVVNVSSIITGKAKPTMSLFAAMKGALDATTKNLAIGLADNNICVNAITPGAIQTLLIHKTGYPEDQIDTIIAQQKLAIPLGRL